MYVIDVDGSNLMRVTSESVTSTRAGSPYGRQIDYRHQPGGDGTTDMYVAGADGTGAQGEESHR